MNRFNKISKRKTMVILTSLALSLTGTAFAAETQSDAKVEGSSIDTRIENAVSMDSFSDVPQGHWAYEALDYLAQHNVIEGYKDGTFQGNRTMTRYEMASIVAKAMKADKGDIGDKAVLKQLESAFQKDIDNMQRQIHTNTEEISAAKKEMDRVKFYGFGRVSWDNDNIKGYADKNDNRRFYLDLKGEFKVNDDWKFAFESETNQRYANYVTEAGDVKYHEGHGDEDGVIQRIWAEGMLGDKLHVDIGRRWRGLGFQNVLLGNETDGIVLDYPLNKNGLKGSAFYQTPTTAGYDVSLYGVGVSGPVSKDLQVNLAYVKLNVGKEDSIGYDPYNGKQALQNTMGSQGYVLSAMWNPMQNITFIGDYVRTNAATHRFSEWVGSEEKLFEIGGNDENTSKSIRLNYRWANIKDPGSFQIYMRWFDYGRHGNIMGDKEWGLLQPGSKGWVLGYKYVPAKNIEWETMFEYADTFDTAYGKKDQTYKRKFIRTQLDFHF